MHGERQGDVGTLTEDFTFSNGQTQQRKWYLTIGPGNTFTVTADDLVGEAQDIVSGATAMLKYRLTHAQAGRRLHSRPRLDASDRKRRDPKPLRNSQIRQ